MPKQNFFEIKSARRRHGLVGIKTTVDGNLRCCVDRRPNFKPHMEAHEIKDGGRILRFYILEANEENRGVGFANHQSMQKLWRCVDRRPPHVAARVGEDGVQTLGFCISKAKEEIYGTGFMKWLRKNNIFEGRLWLDDATVVTFDSGEAVAKRPYGGGEGSSSLRLNSGDV